MVTITVIAWSLRHNMNKLLLFFIIGLTLLSIEAPIAKAEDDLTIGVLTSLSDEWASVGQAIVRGAEMARDEVNSGGGVQRRKIKLAVEDTQEANSGAKAVAAYRTLRLRGIHFFVGPTGTPAGMSLAPIIAKDQVLIITPMVGVKDFSDAAPNIFNARGVDESASRSMASLAFDHGWRQAAVLSSQQPWESAQGRAFQNEFSLLGGKILSIEEPLPDTNDFSSLLAKIVSTKPEVIFFSNSNRVAVAAKQLAAIGYRGPKLAALIDDALVKEAQGSLEGTIFAAFEHPSEEFQKKYEKAYGAKPELGADAAYDSVLALTSALKESPSLSAQETITHLRAAHFLGASGEISFDTNRIAKRRLVQFKVVKDKIVEDNPA
jgi:branched-chain amino acid transport system substrate-binding protein